MQVKSDFPIFQHHPNLVFLDNAATTQKPRTVLQAQNDFSAHAYANIHRAIYDLAASATAKYEGSRQAVADFIDAASSKEIVFTRNATEALNLAAWIEAGKLQAGDEILISVSEHHSNLLPWQRLACKKGVKLQWIELATEQKFDFNDFTKKLSAKTKLVAVAHVANVLGDIRPTREIVTAAHRAGARVILDAAASLCRLPISVRSLDVDYLAASGHKMYGPTGVGFLYAKPELIANAEPMMLGGGTIKKVTRAAALWADSPWRHEAGTPPIVEVIGLAAAIAYLKKLGLETIWQHEQALTKYAWEKLSEVNGIKLFGPNPMGEVPRAGIISFSLSSGNRTFHSHDVAQICNDYGVALRGGHHCAQPLMESLGVEELNRISLGIYNTKEDIDRLAEALNTVRQTLV